MWNIKRLIITVDARMINNSGIGVYIRHFINTLLWQKHFIIILLGRKYELNRYFDDKLFIHVEANFPIYSIEEQIKLPYLIPACDLFWSPHYNAPIFPTRAKKHLVTIPDVYHLAYFSTLGFAQKIYAKLILNLSASKADRIMTISYYSKAQIERFISAKIPQIDVVHLGLDTSLFNCDFKKDVVDIKLKYNLPKSYILFVGNVKPNKNLKALVTAFSQLSEQLPEHQLLIVGKRDGFINGDPALFESIASNPLLDSKIHFTGYVDLEDLPIIYSLADVFAFPSLYEGFGFPPLEAMACGTPVVASDKASIPEICGDAAIYVDPNNIDEFSKALFLLCTDKNLRKQYIEKGLRHVKQYTWQKAGQQFISIIDNLLATQ